MNDPTTRVAFVILVLFMVVGCGSTPSSVPARADHPMVTAPATNPPTSTPKAAIMLLDVRGEGSKQTQSFTTSGDWDLTWTATGGDTDGYFAVTITDATTNTSAGTVGNVTVPAGQTKTDVDHGHRAAKFYLDVTGGNVQWHVTAVG